MKRTFAAIAATALASTSIALATAAAEAKTKTPAQDTATIRVVPKWTYQGGKLAVITKCAYRQDNGTVRSSMLPKPVTVGGSGNVLIRVTKKTSPGKYTIGFWCAAKGLIDAFEETTVKILKTMPGWKQPSAPSLPKHFKAKVTVQSGPPAAKPEKAKKGH